MGSTCFLFTVGLSPSSRQFVPQEMPVEQRWRGENPSEERFTQLMWPLLQCLYPSGQRKAYPPQSIAKWEETFRGGKFSVFEVYNMWWRRSLGANAGQRPRPSEQICRDQAQRMEKHFMVSSWFSKHFGNRRTKSHLLLKIIVNLVRLLIHFMKITRLCDGIPD